jgi:lysophospholipase L1-like esterase
MMTVMKFFFFMTLLFLSSFCYAQIDVYPFLRIEKNEFYLPTNQSFKPFLEKLRKLQSGENEKVHILHIGDSHIQADIFSGRVRQRFADDYRFGVAARGFLFPYRLAKSNNPEDFQVSYTGVWEGKRCALPSEYSRWGLAGITAQTKDPSATFAIAPNIKSSQNEIVRVKVFYPSADNRSYKITLLPEEGNAILSELRTSDYVEFTLVQPQQKVRFALKKTDPAQNNFLLQGISLENNDQGVIYSASGVNGAKVSSYIRCVAFERNLQALMPDLVIISLGTNDAFFDDFNAATFKSNYRYLIDKIRKVAPNASILLTTPGDSFRRRRYPNPDLRVAVSKILEIGKELGVAVWDFYEVMGGFRSVELWQRHLLYQKDYVHLTHQGYMLQGDLLYQAFDKAYRSYTK